MTVTERSTKPRCRETPARHRLPPEERRLSILHAARTVFSKSGDPTGTTMKAIASAAGISEGIIYRHFDSKDQLYFESVVEPLTNAIQQYVDRTLKLDQHPSTETADEFRRLFWRNLIESLRPIVPLLGLVLF